MSAHAGRPPPVRSPRSVPVGAITRRFFLIYEYEPWSNTKRSDEEDEAINACKVQSILLPTTSVSAVTGHRSGKLG